MARRGLVAFAVGVVLPAGLFGCAGPIAVVRQSPSAIELRWMNDENSFDEAARVAQGHCARRAVLDSAFLDQDVTLANFVCRPNLSARMGEAAQEQAGHDRRILASGA